MYLTVHALQRLEGLGPGRRGIIRRVRRLRGVMAVRRTDLRHAGCWALIGPGLVLGLSAAAGCSRSPSRPVPSATAPNVLVVLIDTLRADKLGCYESDLGLTPRIDRLAGEGFLFERAFAHAPWTLPSAASLLTSTYPGRHGAGGRQGDRFRFTKISPEVRTLAECFREGGYETGAIVNVLFLAPKYGIARGFGDFDFRPPEANQRDQRTAGEVTDRAIAWIRRHEASSDRPFFYLAHYFDPHLTYDPPASYRKRFALPVDHARDDELFGTESDMIRLRAGAVDAKLLPMNRLERLYNGEVAYTDEQVGRLVDTLDEMGLAESTLVVLTADHGEEFLDHGGYEHGHTLYDELIQVPLIFRQPGTIAAGRASATVGQIDVGPTVCGLAGIPPEATFQGHSLEPMMSGGSVENRVVLSQGNVWGASLSSLRFGGYKLIERPDGVELYHLATDRRERRDLSRSAGHGGRLAKMREDLALMREATARHGEDSDQVVNLSESEIRRLAALGYIAGSADARRTTSETSTNSEGP